MSKCQSTSCGEDARVFVLSVRNGTVQSELNLCSLHSDPAIAAMWNERTTMSQASPPTTGNVPCDIRAVVADIKTFEGWVWLRERDGVRQMSMPIGSAERNGLIMMLRRDRLVRPHTYQAMAAIIRQLGGSVTRGLIDFLDRSAAPPIVHAKVILQRDGSEVQVDMRASDMLVLCTVSNASFYMESSILDAAAEWERKRGAE